ncbi:tyrosine-type recombinase/integrase [Rhodopirellula bahusiensis]|nr:site-specific integrase [Rhodopirellula bahusiensis]
MAKLRVGNRTDNGVYKNVVLDIGRKVTIGIGYVDGTPKEQSIFTTLEMLETSIIRGQEPNLELRKRLGRLPSGVVKKLRKHDLIAEADKGPTLKELRDQFLADKLMTADPRSVRKYRNALDNGLLRSIDGQRKVSTLDSDDLVKFIRTADKSYAQSTVATQIKRAKAFVGYAVDKGHLRANPFKRDSISQLCSAFTILLTEERSQTQTQNMTLETMERLLQCKKSLRSEIEDAEWNALVHLLRFGGGRVSSYLVLRWRDIDFDRHQILLRMKRTATKRKFVKGAKRTQVVPLFFEMVESLKRLKALQPEGTEFVLNKIGNLDTKPEFETTNAKGERIRQGRWETNLSTTFTKILKRNGIATWAQPLHGFRSFRAAELARNGATEIELNAWIGNSAEVRKRHYGKFHNADEDRLRELMVRKSA